MAKLYELKEQTLDSHTIVKADNGGNLLTVSDHLRWVISKGTDELLNEIEWMVAKEKAKRIK